ncbi:MAG: serine protease [Nitrospinota bacterium]
MLSEDRLHQATGGNEYSIEDYSKDDFRLARRIGKKAGAEFVYLHQRESADNFRGCITIYYIVVVDDPGAFFKAEAVWTPEMSKVERLQVYRKARKVLFRKAWPALRRARARKARRALVREAKKEAPLPRAPAGPDPDMLARLQRLEKEINRLRSQKGSAPAPGSARSACVETLWRSAGTGFYLKGTRHIMTNLHVVGSATQIRISFPQGGTYTGMVIARDANNDVAIVRLQGMSLRSKGFYVDLAASVEPGIRVFAIGYPLGSGISIVSGDVSSATGLDQNAAKFTMTAPINEGNSGGPVIDDTGALVGIAQGGLVQRGVEAVRFGAKISTAAIALSQARIMQKFSIHVVPKKKTLSSRDIFRKFYKHVVRIEVR